MSHCDSPAPPAVASIPPRPAVSFPASADEAGGRGNRFSGATPVPGIAPVDGWSLYSFDEQDGDRFWYDEYLARSADTDVKIHHSRFRFTPSQNRFAWLVRNGFPSRPRGGGWDDGEIEAAMAAEVQS